MRLRCVFEKDGETWGVEAALLSGDRDDFEWLCRDLDTWLDARALVEPPPVGVPLDVEVWIHSTQDWETGIPDVEVEWDWKGYAEEGDLRKGESDRRWSAGVRAGRW